MGVDFADNLPRSEHEMKKLPTISPFGSAVQDGHEHDLVHDSDYRAAALDLRLAGELSIRLITFRANHKLTQKQLGESLGMPDSVISRLERGDRAVDVKTYERVGALLGFEVALVDCEPELVTA